MRLMPVVMMNMLTYLNVFRPATFFYGAVKTADATSFPDVMRIAVGAEDSANAAAPCRILPFQAEKRSQVNVQTSLLNTDRSAAQYQTTNLNNALTYILWPL